MTDTPIPWHTIGLPLWQIAGHIHRNMLDDPARLAELDQSVSLMTNAAHIAGLDLNDHNVLWAYLCGGIQMLAATGHPADVLASVLAGFWTKLPSEATALANQEGTTP